MANYLDFSGLSGDFLFRQSGHVRKRQCVRFLSDTLSRLGVSCRSNARLAAFFERAGNTLWELLFDLRRNMYHISNDLY